MLGQVDLFRGFDAKRPRELAAGQVAMRQGDPCDFLCLLAEGILDVERLHDKARPIRDRLALGEVFGEISLLTSQPRTATVTAAFDSLVYEIPREDLDPILRRRPEIADGLAAVMAEYHARNEIYGRAPQQVTAPTRDDLLARLRQLFQP